MSTRMVRLLALASLILAFASSQTAPAAPSKANVPATPTGKSDGAASANPRGACGAGRAKEHLEHAARDFGGHRGEAVRATEEAIRQLEFRLKYGFGFSRKQIP